MRCAVAGDNIQVVVTSAKISHAVDMLQYALTSSTKYMRQGSQKSSAQFIRRQQQGPLLRPLQSRIMRSPLTEKKAHNLTTVTNIQGSIGFRRFSKSRGQVRSVQEPFQTRRIESG